MKLCISKSLEDTSKIAADWLEITQVTSDRQTGEPTGGQGGAQITGLSGHLGSGKTAFVKAVAKHLGISETVTSPTFVIMKMYPVHGNWKWKRLVHVDAYRLEDAEELESLDWKNVSADPGNLILLEWPENAGIKPTILFEVTSQTERKITFLD